MKRKNYWERDFVMIDGSPPFTLCFDSYNNMTICTRIISICRSDIKAIGKGKRHAYTTDRNCDFAEAELACTKNYIRNLIKGHGFTLEDLLAIGRIRTDNIGITEKENK